MAIFFQPRSRDPSELCSSKTSKQPTEGATQKRRRSKQQTWRARRRLGGKQHNSRIETKDPPKHKHTRKRHHAHAREGHLFASSSFLSTTTTTLSLPSLATLLPPIHLTSPDGVLQHGLGLARFACCLPLCACVCAVSRRAIVLAIISSPPRRKTKRDQRRKRRGATDDPILV